MLFPVSLSLCSYLVISLLGALTGVVGDLIESFIKRGSAIKDSSNVLPGLGGIFDLVNSLSD